MIEPRIPTPDELRLQKIEGKESLIRSLVYYAARNFRGLPHTGWLTDRHDDPYTRDWIVLDEVARQVQALFAVKGWDVDVQIVGRFWPFSPRIIIRERDLSW